MPSSGQQWITAEGGDGDAHQGSLAVLIVSRARRTT
jgi:hypothetical protein